MRITSGTARGHTIAMPSGPTIRPTQDMTRKAVFDILSTSITGARFLDLFAGTGANGIEALSRGADYAAFVDRSRHSIEAIRANLEKTRLSENARVIKSDVIALLRKPPHGLGTFDIVFADPPYQEKLDTGNGPIPLPKMALQLISQGNILHENAVVVIEHDPSVEMPESSGSLSIWRSRKYGSSAITIYREA